MGKEANQSLFSQQRQEFEGILPDKSLFQLPEEVHQGSYETT